MHDYAGFLLTKLSGGVQGKDNADERTLITLSEMTNLKRKMKVAGLLAGLGGLLLAGCKVEIKLGEPTAAEILGNPDYMAMSYSGWRVTKRDNAIAPTVEELKEDMLLISAMGVRVIRTYNTQEFVQTERMLTAIRELKEADPDFEMYVMLGA